MLSVLLKIVVKSSEEVKLGRITWGRRNWGEMGNWHLQ